MFMMHLSNNEELIVDYIVFGFYIIYHRKLKSC